MNTPRTDAARWRLVCRFDQGGEYEANPKRENDGEWVPVDVCAQLETELQAMTALAERLAEAMKNSCNFPGRDWLEAQASAKGHSSVGKWADAKGRKAKKRKGNDQV